MEDLVKVDESGGVLVVALNRLPVNAFNAELVEELERAIDGITQTVARAVIIRGEGRIFSAGADIKMISERYRDADAGQLMSSFAERLQKLFARIERLPMPSIAVVRGAATGGGFELALACDFRVVAEDARLGLTEVKIGLVPGAGGTQRLPRLVGRAQAMRLILRGELLSGREAEQLGNAQWALPEPAVEAYGRQFAGELASLSAPAVAAAKRCVTATDAGDGYKAELDSTRALMGMPETGERLAAFFSRGSKRT